MRVLLTTNEYPPYVYGGAGVHVEYLSRELAKLTPVKVRSFHDQPLMKANFGYVASKWTPPILPVARSPLSHR